MRALSSWGRFPRAPEKMVVPLAWASDPLPARPEGGSMLAYGQGRSYGDACLNEGGTLLPTGRLDRLLAFDPASGVVRCEAGVTLAQLLRFAVWQGWFLPVTPGTKFVSVGGAIANDVHGKNHHLAGTFGRHVRRFELLRSDGSRRVCSPTEHPEWYAATIGGLGLTGLVTWAEVQLRRIANPYLFNTTVPLGHVGDFFRVTRESDRDYEMAVAWVDCLARGRRLGRGLYYLGNHAPPQTGGLPGIKRQGSGEGLLAVPFDLPSFTLNRLSVRAFNALYYAKGRAAPATQLVHYEPYFYPLDSVGRWNRIYGRKGLLQFQCVVPERDGEPVMRELLDRIARSGFASFLAVLKRFGDVPSPGMLSFPRPGYTLSLDFANRGEKTRRLFAELERVTREAGGALYPAKDALMTPETFRASYPALARFRPFVDPAFSSSLWRRVHGAAT